MSNDTGKYFILIGVILIVIGIIWYFWGDKLSFIGKLPGDIRIEKDNFSFYFPITTMIIISILLNFIIRLFR